MHSSPSEIHVACTGWCDTEEPPMGTLAKTHPENMYNLLGVSISWLKLGSAPIPKESAEWPKNLRLTKVSDMNTLVESL